MALNFPANPSPNSKYVAPNGVTYLWNDSIQSWVVEAINYDSDYVNITGDTMTGPLDFNSFTTNIGIWWGGNPKIRFDRNGTSELRGKFATLGDFRVNHGIHFDHNTSNIWFKDSPRIVFTQSKTTLTFGTEEFLHIDTDGVKYMGNFLNDKNVTTVEYVTNEVQSLQNQIDLLNYDLEGTIVDVINDKAVLLTGNQTVEGTKTFTKQIVVDKPNGQSASNGFVVKGRVGPSNSYGVLLKDYHRPSSSSSNDYVSYYGQVSAENNIVNKKYVDDNSLKSVSGTSGEPGDSGIRVNSKSGRNQQIYAVKATRTQYGVSVKGELPTGTSTPSSDGLLLGQMFFDTTNKRVFIRVN